MALRFVQGSIVNFGGNPNQVSIIGCSGGGTAVTELMVSPLSRGLFTNAIPQSAAPMQAAWAVNSQARGLAIGDAIIRYLNCNTGANTLSCLRALPKERIYQAGIWYVNHGRTDTHVMHPTWGCVNCWGDLEFIMPSVDGVALTK